MCRHLAYLGPPVPLARLLTEPPHSLLHQSWAPADMRGGGTINADGYGVGWYPGDGRTALRYRCDRPMWADAGLPALAAAVMSRGVLAAVRSATVGMPIVETAVAPFTDGPWLFSHNGAIAGWPDSVAKVASQLPTVDLLTLDAPTDAALLWALVRARLRAGATPARAVAETVTEVADAAPGSRLNLLLTDGTQIVATTAGHALSVRRADGLVLVSSEPLDDDPSWEPVPPGRLVVATTATVDIAEWGSP
ncbi:ergothioneine biosynthesis protein EgtC [Planosporangium thailandense]|uniref:Gamma-glutamyl-hercynylcysteine sulfoxide hydrolase n=1 Tax=Planosporangium thailandense TaxID=765197 RepID=A0ABX0Y644_9ACTN|nr:ergothioneine biosynthesis protein EgtC [Planosporangium thailandense]NJC73813.1 ergothioneine biosynthesis protein EgtC [Planosporangium thailandense]